MYTNLNMVCFFFQIHNGRGEIWPSKRVTKEPSRFWMVVESREMLPNPELGGNKPTMGSQLQELFNRTSQLIWLFPFAKFVIQLTLPKLTIHTLI